MSTILGQTHKLNVALSKSCGHAPFSHYPDVLKVFAVDRIENTVGSHKFHCTLDVDVGHDPTLVILNKAEACEATVQAKVQVLSQESSYAGVVPPYDVPDDDGAIFKMKLKKEETSSNTTSVSIMDEAKFRHFSVVSIIRPQQGFLCSTLISPDSICAATDCRS